jgi:PelA/Pel-15E family pectate lyase
MKINVITVVLIAVSLNSAAQKVGGTQGSLSQKYAAVDPEIFADNANHWYNIFDKNNVINPRAGRPKYNPDQLLSIADNILLFQKENGGWPKNYDMLAILTLAQKDSLIKAKSVLNTTYDNGSTFTQITVLARIYSVTKEKRYRAAVLRGFDYLLESQYDNGGWPQYYPLESNYSSHITYNDGNFEGIMELLRDIYDNKPEYAFLDDDYRGKLRGAYERAIPCILKTQINDAGKPTAWCQQYDEITLAPAWARKFEPPGICNKESADLVIFLMGIEHPQKEVVEAIQNAVTWFEDSKIYNTEVKVVPAPKVVTPFRISETDRKVVANSTAPPIWARYYELKTHKPMFCDRDSKIVYTLAEISRERRDGYAWYTYAPQQVLDKYPGWQRKHGIAGKAVQ